MASTPAIAAAEQAGIRFTLHEYEHDSAADSTHLDASARDHETILVSAGRRGLQIELAPDDFVRLTDARVHAIAAG